MPNVPACIPMARLAMVLAVMVLQGIPMPDHNAMAHLTGLTAIERSMAIAEYSSSKPGTIRNPSALFVCICNRMKTASRLPAVKAMPPADGVQQALEQINALVCLS